MAEFWNVVDLLNSRDFKTKIQGKSKIGQMQDGIT
jgi:hypothetical protein